MIKLLALVRRRPDLSPEEFARYWTTVHAPLAEAQGPRGYVIDVRNPEQPAGALEDIDGVAEIWWDDHDHMERGLTSEAGRIAAADVANFAAEVRFIVVDPTTVLPPPT
ncbi:MAG: EthD domain-containing protein [Nitriliruptoraceae bacterium]